MEERLQRLKCQAKELVPHYSKRKWNATFGLSIERVLSLDLLTEGKITQQLLWLLLWLKLYPTFDVCSNITKIDVKTFKKGLELAKEKLEKTLPEVCLSFFFFFIANSKQLDFSERWRNWKVVSPSAIFDGAECPIKEPVNMSFTNRKQFYSRKCKGAGLKYIFAVHVETGYFLWVSAAFPGGASEPAIVIDNLGHEIIDNERWMGDRLFRNYKDYFIVAEAHDCEYSDTFNSIRSLVERRIGLLNNMGIFRDRYRSFNYDLHQSLVHLMCRIFNFVEI